MNTRRPAHTRRSLIISLAMSAAAVLGLAILGGARAQGADDCTTAPNQMQANGCVSENFARADAELNRVYAVLRGKLDALGKRNLVAAERAWLAWRDSECNLRTGYDPDHPDAGGTFTPMMVGQCRTGLTRRRIDEIRDQIRCPAGNPACPV